MYNTKLASIKELENGNLAISTPYNGAFVKELKANVPSARWSGNVWVISPTGQKQAETLLAKYYPAQETLQKVRISWALDRDDPSIDGVSLASIGRDHWNWRSNCPIDFEIIENDVNCGGSRKNPGLYGKLVIETTVRPGAEITPRAEVVVIEDGESINPLANFSTEDLIAELKRRNSL